MNNKESLIGKTVSLFLDGGWEVAGEVKSSDDNKFIVEQDGDLFMVFKDKISCLSISESARVLKPTDLHLVKEEKEGKGLINRSSNRSSMRTKSGSFPMNGISYDESTMSIPGGLLSEAVDDDDDDLSVSFPGEQSISFDKEDALTKNHKSIEFKIEDDTKN